MCDRLHYEPWELCLFENIECQWPLFYCFLVINGCFSGKEEEVRELESAVEDTKSQVDNMKESLANVEHLIGVNGTLIGQKEELLSRTLVQSESGSGMKRI